MSHLQKLFLETNPEKRRTAAGGKEEPLNIKVHNKARKEQPKDNWQMIGDKSKGHSVKPETFVRPHRKGGLNQSQQESNAQTTALGGAH